MSQLRSHLLAKTGSRDRVQLVLLALRSGVVRLDEVLAPDLAHCGVVGLLGGWLLLGLWGLRGLGCALTWGYESVRSHGQDGVGGPCGADRALLPEGGAQHRAHWLGP